MPYFVVRCTGRLIAASLIAEDHVTLRLANSLNIACQVAHLGYQLSHKLQLLLILGLNLHLLRISRVCICDIYFNFTLARTGCLIAAVKIRNSQLTVQICTVNRLDQSASFFTIIVDCLVQGERILQAASDSIADGYLRGYFCRDDLRSGIRNVLVDGELTLQIGNVGAIDQACDVGLNASQGQLHLRFVVRNGSFDTAQLRQHSGIHLVILNTSQSCSQLRGSDTAFSAIDPAFVTK